jgi:DNA-binding MarR family transcriptional regulator
MVKMIDMTTEIGLGKRLRLAHIAFSRGMRVELGLVSFSFGQFVHLERLWDEDGLSQVELSRRVGVEVASSTAVIAELERLHLIRRVRDVKDKRKIKVFLTDEGRSAKVPIIKAVRRVNRIAGEEIDSRRIPALFSQLDAITAKLNAKYQTPNTLYELET